MKEQIERLIETATKAYEFAPGSYTWFALTDAVALRRQLESQACAPLTTIMKNLSKLTLNELEIVRKEIDFQSL